MFDRIQITNEKIQDRKLEKKAKADKRILDKEIEMSKRRRKTWMLALGDRELSPDDYAELIDEEDTRMKGIAAQYFRA